jgi:signal transduction histidine kinase
MSPENKEPSTKHTILVVDDEPMLLELVALFLEPRGYEVVLAGDGVEALMKLQQVKVDVVLTDYAMHEMNGIELLARIKTLYPTIRVALMSGTLDMDAIFQTTTANLCADAFIGKPFMADELCELVGRLCTSEGRRAQNALVDFLEAENKRLRSWLQEKAENTENLQAFCTHLAHSLKGEFLNISSSANRIQKLTIDSSDIQEECVVIAESMELSRILVRRLIDFLGVAKPQLTPVRVGELFDRLALLARPRLSSGISLEMRADEPVRGQTLQGDLEQLLGVLLEIVHNAGKALRGNGGLIQLEFAIQDQAIVITIRDDGPGIPEEVKAKLFQEQVRSTGGMGLGLYLCQKVIKGLGGELRLASSTNCGTTITVTLPTAPINEKH